MGSVFELKLHLANDWTAFERNQLHALVARLSTHSAEDIAFGVSDEGDPWCAILDSSDDVILHVARIRGRFVVHAAQENAVSEARDLWSAVTYFTAANAPGAASQRSDVLPDHIFAAMAVEDAREIAPPPAQQARDEGAPFAPHPLFATALGEEGHDGHAAPAPGDTASPASVIAGLSYEPLIATTAMSASSAADAAVHPAAPIFPEASPPIRLETLAASAPDAAAAHAAAPQAMARPVAAQAHDAPPIPPTSVNPLLIEDPKLGPHTADGEDAVDGNAFRPALVDHSSHPAPATGVAAGPNVLLVGGWMPSANGGQTFGIVAEVVGGRGGLLQSPPGAHVDFIAIGADTASGAGGPPSSHPILDPPGEGLDAALAAHGTSGVPVAVHAPPAPANDFGPMDLDHLPMEPVIHVADGVWASPDPLHGP